MLPPTSSDLPEDLTTPPETPELTDDELIEKVAEEIVDRRLAAPAIFLLESSKPVTFIASQGLVFLGPFVDAALSVPSYDQFCDLLEDRSNVEKLIVRIEAREEERLTKTRAKKDDPSPDGEKPEHGPSEG
ncbi:MAG TPA: hypothetical protein QGH10_27120 [Armatimonadota bacterium]|nr:hypothetical protein [Armatimonadota bacterium]